MSNSCFRKAVEADIDAITAIYDAIHVEEEAGRATIGWNRSIYPTRKTAIDSVAKGEMFVLEIDDRVVASMRLNSDQEDAYRRVNWLYEAADEDVLVMHTLTVDPTAARRGIGQNMVILYETYAADHGYHYLRIDTNARNARARKMYSKLGYIESGIIPTTFNGIGGVQLVCMEKKLDPAGT